ncbi:MAG TPA: GAF and ANTAR domain-containing protein [Steroidobacteraceae bacterium]|nr:GAF and ANTAR domain-containing protein [Steroidobacteraceae bacterium]
MKDCTELQNALLDTHNVEEFLQRVADMATREVADGVSCGMTMRPNGRPATVACSDPVAARVDEVQYRLDDGPCLHAMRDGEMVSIPDTAAQARWPEFEAEAAAAGIRSCLALPLAAKSPQAIGALNLYARTASAFGETETWRARNFARNASGALLLAKRLASYASLNEQLRASLVSRSVIDQALGIIMARGGIEIGGTGQRCTQARAFELLRAASQNTNIKLRDIARAIVTSATGEPVQLPPPFQDPDVSVA